VNRLHKVSEEMTYSTSSLADSDFERYVEYDEYPKPHCILGNILLDRLITRACLPPDARFLDIGCGRGSMLVRMAERGYQGVGIDLQPICVEISRRRTAGSGVEVRKGDFGDLHESFDLIIVISVLEHIEDDRAALRKIWKLLNPKGYFLFRVPGDIRLFGDRDIAYGHYRRYEKAELIDKLRETGFEVDTLWSYGMNSISKLYRFFVRRDIKKRIHKPISINAANSSIVLDDSDIIKRFYPIYSKLMFLYNFQILFLNSKFFRSNYVGLCKKIEIPYR
jgi:2-polyprenyl-3-methyl-5-hydroxy-6-metoxy-1,4-benzoquinol methylase